MTLTVFLPFDFSRIQPLTKLGLLLFYLLSLLFRSGSIVLFCEHVRPDRVNFLSFSNS